MSRESVLTVALELFALRGVDGVSIADIADAATMSKANVLHHFGTKDQLYRACLEEVGERLEAAAAAAGRAVDETDVDPEAAVSSALERWASDHADDVRLMAYGLLRLRERPGTWVLEDAIAALMRVIGGSPERAAEIVLASLGQVTYQVMSQPLLAALEATARRSRTTTTTATTN